MTPPQRENPVVTPPARPPRRWRRRRWLLGLLLLPPLAAAGLWGYVAWMQHRAIVNLAEAIAEADRLDPGWRIDDLQAHRAELPDDRNAALRILALRAKLPADFPNADLDQSLESLTPNVRLTGPQHAALAGLLTPVAGLRAEARTLADTPNGRFPLELQPSVIAAVIKSTEARAVLSVLRYDLLDRLEADDLPGALTDWRAAFHVGRAVGDEPLIISQITRAHCRTTALAMLERLLAQAEPGEADLARLQHLLEDDEAAPLFLIAARGERAGAFQTIEEIKAQSAKTPLWSQWRSAALGVWNRHTTVSEAIALLPGSLPGQQARVLDLETRLVEIVRRPVEDWKPLLDAWLTEADRAGGLVRMLTPAAGKVGEAFRRSHAELRCAIAAVAAERYRRRHGRWSADWDELTRAGLLRTVPIDPYDGRPLRLRSVADGLVVYSVGADGTDDGGNLSRTGAPAPGTDRGFRLWDADRRRQSNP